MKRWRWLSSLSALFLALALVPAVALAGPPVPDADQHSWVVERGTGQAYRVAHNPHVGPYASNAPTGLIPSDIRTAYSFSASLTAGAGKTIAIVDAYHDPNALADLNTFSSQFGLPQCTTANPCFQQVDQRGGTKYPSVDAGWALEISLDIQWAHAIAPGAKILLVEADSNSFTDLMIAEDYAKTHGAQYVSNSWGASEFIGENTYDSHFAQGGVSFFVSSGDNGTPAEYPSSSANVISVGGTTLSFTNGALKSETGWSGSGGGCSRFEQANSFQVTDKVKCRGARATPDVALDADPNSGVSVYDSTSYNGSIGWFKVGGTSASAPMWAARSAVAGTVVDAAYVYGSAINYRDITSGNNGGARCQAGYDLVTGRGSWTGATP
jgi:subtilase family serine protease